MLTSVIRMLWRPFADNGIRVEDYVDGETFVVRAELPGFDPARHIQLAIAGGELRIRAERDTADWHAENGHSDFRYGSFYRGVRLPVSTCTETVRARYDQGILEIRFGLDKVRLPGARIPVEFIDAPRTRPVRLTG